MYPPREERGETPAPVNEFVCAMWVGAVWIVWGLLYWEMSANGRRALWRILLGVAWWINAWSIKAGWTSKRRWVALGGYLVVATVGTYVLGW
jgi:hypothetical protein